MIERVATLEEIDRHWSLMDVVHANEAIDAVHAAEREMRERAAKARK